MTRLDVYSRIIILCLNNKIVRVKLGTYLPRFTTFRTTYLNILILRLKKTKAFCTTCADSAMASLSIIPMSSVRLLLTKCFNCFPIKDWAFESRDLGAKFATTIFDCQDEGKFKNSLIIIKEAFQISNKNYQ